MVPGVVLWDVVTPGPDVLFSLIDKYGLPLGMFALFGVSIVRRWFVTGSELDRKVKILEDEIAYREHLRGEERSGRVAAEDRLDKTIEAMKEQTALLRDIDRELLRGDRP